MDCINFTTYQLKQKLDFQIFTGRTQDIIHIFIFVITDEYQQDHLISGGII